MAYVKIEGTALVALALFAFLALAMGISFNQLVSGMGNLLLGLGGLCLGVIIIAIIWAARR